MIHYRYGKDGIPLEVIAEAYWKRLNKKGYLERFGLGNLQNLSDNHKDFINLFYVNDGQLLQQIITSKPSEFAALATCLNEKNEDLGLPMFGTRPAKEWRNRLWDIFGYKELDTLIGRDWLLEQLNIKVCPYCNIQLLPKLARAGKKKDMHLLEMDHFLPKSLYPYFSLSFYNLIPACLNCNQRLKGKTHTRLETHVHPYENSLDEMGAFNIYGLGTYPASLETISLIPRKGLRNKEVRRLVNQDKLFSLAVHNQTYLDEIGQMSMDYYAKKRDEQYYLYLKDSNEKLEQVILRNRQSNPFLTSFEEKWGIPRSSNGIQYKRLGKLKRDAYIILSGEKT